MLTMRPGCERCDKDLPADQAGAYSCSFECTYCADCAVTLLQQICPTCGGELLPRPRRPTHKLGKYPASTERIYRPLVASDAG
ncbi:DUF1272 domain-containing protein [Chitinimonas arctica]|uniref:DUF1272 domain-containing protein n=1 Tax=Chitinimonas arctica TaxID=2594795 RepID=A0A516SB32_9NEIS|nr:DUF1272 domain-containing protein [Chitinimonas arctica]QDQ25361.1 DUF1272 domain-containing protein [Chitinimonas arctica]